MRPLFDSEMMNEKTGSVPVKHLHVYFNTFDLVAQHELPDEKLISITTRVAIFLLYRKQDFNYLIS